MKNKGFTIVELLGVLVIIVVVALITVPIVYTNIENVRLQADKRNTDKLIKTASDYYEKNVMNKEKNEELIIECDGSTCYNENNQSQELDFSGAKPKGHITISEYGEVLQVDLLFNRYVCSYIDEEIECKKPDLVIDNIDDFNTFLSKADEYDNKIVVLSSDLDYSGKSFTQYSKTFKGEFNGLGYSIENITFNGEYHGIFFAIENATIKSLKVENSSFTINMNTDNIGVIIGSSDNSNIYNCYSIGNDILSNSNIVGGIVGQSSSSNINNCSSLRIIINNLTNNNHGGIVGQASNNSVIDNCVVLDSYISGDEFVGGIVGQFAGKINNSYSKNVLLNGNSSSVGMVGSVINQTKVNNCYISYDASNSEIINKIKNNNIQNNLNGNIKVVSSGGGIIGKVESSVEVNNCYNKNIIFDSNDKNSNGYMIGTVNSQVMSSFNNNYALSISNEYIGNIGSVATSNTIIFNYNDAISYKSNDISSISDFKNNLDKNWDKTGKYPKLYKIDKNGNPTPYLLGGQE